MKQSKIMSFLESIINVMIGYGIAVGAQIVIFPWFGLHVPLSQNLMIGGIFTIISIIRSFALRRLFEAMHIRMPFSPAILAVIEERRRQIHSEGWTEQHDNRHASGELALAGAAYAKRARGQALGDHSRAMPNDWPFKASWWKPTDLRRNLIKAAALIIAEIERHDRLRKVKTA